MLIDARSLPHDTWVETDICIVGAGTAGLTLAYSLIGKGLDVTLLESGGLKPDRESHGLNWGKNIGLPYYALDMARARYFGGSCNRWHVPLDNSQLGARIRPLDEIDFEERDWVPNSGWPFAKADLNTYYDKAQELCQTAPYTYGIGHWAHTDGYEILPLDRDVVKTIVFKFCAKDPFTKLYADVVKNADDIRVFLYANVNEIETDETVGKVTGLKVACLGGNRFRVTARQYVLAAGGIEIPRLLLTSTQRMGCGIGNQHDLVGRYFMEHLHFWKSVFVPSDSHLMERLTLYNSIQRVDGVPIIAKLALSEETMRREKLINHNIQLIPRIILKSELFSYTLGWRPSGGYSALMAVLSALKHGRLPDKSNLQNTFLGAGDTALYLSRETIRKIVKTFDRRRASVYYIANMTEQVPNPDSRITLDTERDKLGLRRVRLDWKVTQQDLSNAVRVQEIIGRELERVGLGRLYIRLKAETVPNNLHGGYHHMGTTRMHREPKKGVVDPNCRIHGLSNIYIAGPSVFPTGGHANPVLTLIALTLRLSDHLLQIMR